MSHSSVVHITNTIISRVLTATTEDIMKLGTFTSAPNLISKGIAYKRGSVISLHSANVNVEYQNGFSYLSMRYLLFGWLRSGILSSIYLFSFKVQRIGYFSIFVLETVRYMQFQMGIAILNRVSSSVKSNVLYS